jgi:hypothetical protein
LLVAIFDVPLPSLSEPVVMLETSLLCAIFKQTPD